MNERIKQLMTESGIFYKPMVVDGVEYEYRHVEFNDWKFEDEADCLEKFIEALVKDIADSFTKMDSSRFAEFDRHDAAKHVLKYPVEDEDETETL
jgi:hypothetical protein